MLRMVLFRYFIRWVRSIFWISLWARVASEQIQLD